MKVLLRKLSPDTYQIVTPQHAEKFKGVAVGDIVQADIKQSRNPRLHRLYFALLDVMFENQIAYEDFNLYRKMVLYWIGEVNVLGFVDGKEICEPKSISYSEMNNAEFTALYEKTLTFALNTLFQGVDKGEVENYLNSFL